MNSIFEELHSELNQNIFYSEFTFSKTNFLKSPGESKEFADHLTWIDDLLIIYQLKERNEKLEHSSEAEEKWFYNKVIKKATKQIKSTLNFLYDFNDIEICNQKGHNFKISPENLKHILKLVIYAPSKKLPNSCLDIRHKISSTAGFIHIIPWHDYVGICRTLITPAELIEYFEFRKTIFKKYESKIKIPSEQALVGQFLSIHINNEPKEEYVDFLYNLTDKPSDFDISYLLHNMGENITFFEGSESELGYYDILAEFAKLNRAELREIKKRIVLCLKAVENDKFMSPVRIISAFTGCGFVFIPVPSEVFDKRKKALKNYTIASKYENRLRKHVGVTFAKKGNDSYVEWCLLDFPWKQNKEIEKMLYENYPFSKLKAEIMPRYNYEKSD